MGSEKSGNPHPTGRKPKLELSEADIEVLEKLSSVLTKQQLAHYFGMSKTTLLRIFKDFPEYAEMCAAGKAKAIADIGCNLQQRAAKGDQKAAEFFLATQAGWVKTERIEQSVKVKSFSDMYNDDDETEDE